MDENGEDLRPLTGVLYNEENDRENIISYESDEPLTGNRSYGIQLQRRKKRNWFYLFVFIAFGVLGTIPWNFFINANEFWEYKFRDVNQTGPVDPKHRNDLQSKFESFLSIAAQVPALIGSVACTLLSSKFKTHYRIMVPMVSVLALFATVTGVSELNTDTWQLNFLLFTLLTVAIINCLMAYGQCSLMGFAGTIHPKYMNGMMTGQAVGGVIASIARILTIFFKGSIVEASRYYFIFALIIIFATVALFFILSRTGFYKYHISKIEDGRLLINSEDQPLPKSIWLILKQIKLYVFSIIIVFITTLAIFPSVSTLVVSVDHGSGSIWTGCKSEPVFYYS
ncbi:Epsin-1, required for endocytosis and actin patch assembly, variant 2 [Chamberlinius hualienensis]